MLPLRLRSIAEAELAEAVTWYAAQSPAVPARFLEAIARRVMRF